MGIWETFKQEWPTIKNAPRSFATLVVVVAIIFFSSFQFIFKERLEGASQSAANWKQQSDYWQQQAQQKAGKPSIPSPSITADNVQTTLQRFFLLYLSTHPSKSVLKLDDLNAWAESERVKEKIEFPVVFLAVVNPGPALPRQTAKRPAPPGIDNEFLIDNVVMKGAREAAVRLPAHGNKVTVRNSELSGEKYGILAADDPKAAPESPKKPQ